MIPIEWIATVSGAVLCLLYSWFLGTTARSHGVRIGKMNVAVGVVGISVLAGMAVVGPMHVSEPKGGSLMQTYTLEGYPRASQGVTHFAKLLSVASRTTSEVGRRPSKNHVAHEHPDGKLEWVTKEKYGKLIKGKNRG